MSPVAQAVLVSWSVPFWPTLALLLTAAFYARGWKNLRVLRSTLLPDWRLASFLAGLTSLWLAIASPLDAFANFLLTAHMIQHMLLMFVAPPLILMGSPQIPLLRGLPRSAARYALGPFLAWPLLKRFGRALTHPAFCWFTSAVVLLGWHVPAAYDLALRSTGWHQIEHACFCTTSLLFWWSVIEPWPTTRQWPRWSIPVYLLCAGFVSSVLAAFLCFSDQLLYPAYAAVPRLFGLSEVDDQAAAGAIMWVFGSLILLCPAAIITVQLLEPSIAKPPAGPGLVRLSRAPLAPFDLLRAPIAGSLLRARYGRRALQAILLVIAAAVIVDGFFGHHMAPMNLAGVLPWTYGRALIVITLLAAGNFFCMACPFTLVRELGRRLGLAARPWPLSLRTKWLAAGLLVLFFWAYEAFKLWDNPIITAWVLAGYFAAAFVVDTIFRDASFCKYVCPIGQFNFLSSLVSPLEVKVRRQETCNACATHDCLRGNQHQRGCELHLFLPRKAGNMDCTFCLDCVKACPSDNIGILVVAPGRDLVRDPARSSLGRLSCRPDIAALALIVVFSAFVTAGGMVSPVTEWRDRLPIGSSLFASLLFCPIAMFLMGLAMQTGKHLGKITTPARELFCRFSLALLPVGLAVWGAHLLFHLSTAWNTAWPVVQRALMEIGIGWLGAPHWTPAAPILATDSLLAIQILVLDAGILLSLYVGWRIAGAYAKRTGEILRLFAPWAAVAASLYVAGIWIFLQPMQMRGMVHG
jgi:cytochrome c oxidase assembly factor CtaG